MQADLNTVVAPPTQREVLHAQEVAEGRGGKVLLAAHGPAQQRFPIEQARKANDDSDFVNGEARPFKLSPPTQIESAGCDRHHRVSVPYNDPDGEEGVAVLCITCDGLAVTPDFGRFPRYES